MRVSSKEEWTDMMIWTRHAAKAKEKAMEEKENTEAKEFSRAWR